MGRGSFERRREKRERDEPGDDVVLVIRVSSELSELFGVGELDVDTVLLHDSLMEEGERKGEEVRSQLGSSLCRVVASRLTWMFFPPTPMILLW